MRLQKTCILLANGMYPNHSIPLNIINEAKEIICLDGAADKAFHNNLNPSLIIGDLDSISESVKKKHSKIIIETPDQNKNDLEKGLDWIEVQDHPTDSRSKTFHLTEKGKQFIKHIEQQLDMPYEESSLLSSILGLPINNSNDCNKHYMTMYNGGIDVFVAALFSPEKSLDFPSLFLNQ